MAHTCEQEVVKPGMERVLCDLCRSNDCEVILKQRDLLLNVTEDEFLIVRCRSCGLIYLNPRPTRRPARVVLSLGLLSSRCRQG